MTVTITGPDFVACIGFTSGRATEVPASLQKLTGWTIAEVRLYAERQRWKFKQNEE